MEFEKFAQKFNLNFRQLFEIEKRVLFETDAEKEKLWELYLSSFPKGTNEIYRKRTEHDCSCCRHFLYELGGKVWIDDDLRVHSLFDFKTEDRAYQTVVDALDYYVTSRKITGFYIGKEEMVGTAFSREMQPDGRIITYSHFGLRLPRELVFDKRTSSTIDTLKGNRRDTRNVFERSLDTISADAINTVLELIQSNNLYKGEEWKKALDKFAEYKAEYDALSDNKKGLYCWIKADKAENVIGRIKNHSIGTLLVDISEGRDLDEAVKAYERIVAPTNYRRPKAIYTKKMLEEAEKTISSLGYMDSLRRRFATLDDISVNDILFSDRDSAKRISGSIFDDMKADITIDPKKFSRCENMDAEQFIHNVLPFAKQVEVLFENRHTSNMVSLIAPEDKSAKSMFKWNNSFSWAYNGNLTDSDIRENVKNAGGNIDGALRFSIQWNDGADYDQNDVDAHCIEPDNNEIAFFNKRSFHTGGELDVDIIHPQSGKAAVENIVFPDKRRMKPGTYNFYVQCYSYRFGKSGFRAEIEFGGNIYRYNFNRSFGRSHENIFVAKIVLDDFGNFRISHALPSEETSREVWGVKTNTFIPCSVIMRSPNYWYGAGEIGHKHTFFMLKNCINPETPNGFYNEFLKQELSEHKRVFEALGSRLSVPESTEQLSGVGFSSTKHNDIYVKVKNNTEQIFKINF